MILISCPTSGAGEVAFPFEKPKSPSSAYSAAPGRIGGAAKESGTKSMAVNEESAASIASGEAICWGGKANVPDGDILLEDQREPRRRAHARWIRRVGNAEIVAGSADRVEHRLVRGQEPEAVRPAVVVRRAIGVLAGQLQAVRRVVRRPRAALVGAVLTDEKSSEERVPLRREPEGISVPVAPGERLDVLLRMRGRERRPEDGAVADALVARALERLHRCAGASHAEGGIPARHHSATRVEDVLAEHDV